MFQIRMDAELYALICEDPDYEEKLERHMVGKAHLLARKQIVMTFPEESHKKVFKYLKRFGPAYERKGGSDKDPVHGGRYRTAEIEKHKALKDPTSPEQITTERQP